MLGNFTTSDIINYLILLPGLFISLAIHEFAHAYTAYKLGDKSQKAQGRLTLSPFAHIDWMGFIAISLLGFGWGKPVQVDNSNFKKPNQGLMLTSLAGPLSNLILGAFLILVYLLLVVLKVFDINALFQTMITPGTITVQYVLFKMLISTISFNIIFAVFNMIPIPPFDGSKVLFYFLPYKFRKIEEIMYRYSFLFIVILFVTNIDQIILSPVSSLVTNILGAITALGV